MSAQLIRSRVRSRAFKALALSVAAYIEPPEKILPSEWAQKHVHITEGDDLGLVNFNNGREYQIDILDSLYGPFKPGETRRIGVCFKGAQAGISLISQIGALYRNLVLRRSVAHMYPREPDSREKAKKLKEMIDASPYLASKYTKGDRRIRRTVDGQTFRIPYASSMEELINWQCGDFIVDEVDRSESVRYSAIDALKQRTGSYSQVSENYVGTPTLPDFGIHLIWLESDQRRYWVPCLSCGRTQIIEWETNIEFSLAPKTLEERAKTARMKCAHCDVTWDTRMRQIQNAQGNWIATHPEKPVIGFGVSRLYVPSAQPEKMVSDYLKGLVDDRAMREHVNQNLGNVYMPTYGKLSKNSVERVIDPNQKWKAIPEDTVKITAGIDVQGEAQPFEYVYEIRAYNDDNFATVVEYGVATKHSELEDLLGTREEPGIYDVDAALIDITDGQHKLDVEELCAEIPCLAPGRFDHHHKTEFNSDQEKKIKSGSTAGYGYALDREAVLEMNLSRFYTTEKRGLKIKVAHNPSWAKKDDFVDHYTLIARRRDKTGKLIYKKLKTTGVDYPFAGAMADKASELSIGTVGKGHYGAVEDVIADEPPIDESTQAYQDMESDDYGLFFLPSDSSFF